MHTMAQQSALCVVAGHFETEDTVVLRAELRKCQERLAKYEAMLPDLVPRSAEFYQEMKSQYSHVQATSCGTVRTITLKACSETNTNCDNVRVAGLLQLDRIQRHVYSFAFDQARSPFDCALLIVKFGAQPRQRKEDMFEAIGAFLQLGARLPNCHRIFETINFIDEFDETTATMAERAEDIQRRLPQKMQAEPCAH